jgi:hypothetical protein
VLAAPSFVIRAEQTIASTFRSFSHLVVHGGFRLPPCHPHPGFQVNQREFSSTPFSVAGQAIYPEAQVHRYSSGLGSLQGSDYIFTIAFALGAGRSCWSLRGLNPSSSLCTFSRCISNLAQDCPRNSRLGFPEFTRFQPDVSAERPNQLGTTSGIFYLLCGIPGTVASIWSSKMFSKMLI